MPASGGTIKTHRGVCVSSSSSAAVYFFVSFYLVLYKALVFSDLIVYGLLFLPVVVQVV